MRFPKYALPAVAIAALAMALIGCGSNNSLGPGANTTSMARFYNGLIGVPSIDTELATTALPRFQTGIGFESVSSYMTTRSGNGVNTYIFAAGGTTPLLQSIPQIDLTPNTNYTVMVIGINSLPQSNLNGPQSVRLTDIPPVSQIRDSAGNPLNFAAVRVFHGAPNTITPVTVYNEANGGAPIQGFTNIAYGTASGNSNPNTTNGYVLFDTTNNPYSFTVRDSNNPGTVLASIPNVTFQPGLAYTLVITGSADATQGAPLIGKFLQDYPLQ